VSARPNDLSPIPTPAASVLSEARDSNMPCGGCGGGDIKVPVRRTTPSAPKRTSMSVQREMRPKPLRKIIPVSKPRVNRKLIQSSELARTAKKRAANTRLCPVCGAPLSIEITGKTRRKRFRCNRCCKTYM